MSNVFKQRSDTFKPNDALLTHEGCLDGAGCALVFMFFGGRRENIYFTPPAQVKSDRIAQGLLSKHDGTLYIADVSISEQLAEEIGASKRVKLLDHHKSALPLSRFRWCEIEKLNRRCGSLMLYDYALRNLSGLVMMNDQCTLRQFINAIDDRDRWRKKIPAGEDLSNLFHILQQQKFIDVFSENLTLQFDDRLKFVLEIERSKREAYLQRKTKETLGVYQITFGDRNVHYVVATCDAHYASDLGHELLNRYDVDVAFLALGNIISLRSKDTFDCSEFATIFGGGGHKNAAGFLLENLTGQSTTNWIKEKLTTWTQNAPGHITTVT